MTAIWFIFENFRTSRAPWAALNLISTTVLGRGGYVIGFGVATVIGLAIHLVVSGIYGVLFAMVVTPRVRPFLAANMGLLFSFIGFALTFIWILPRVAPYVFHYALRLQWAGAHFLGGMVLGLYPDMARRLMYRPPAALPPAPLPPDEPPAADLDHLPELGSPIGDAHS